MSESYKSGSVRGVRSNAHPYRGKPYRAAEVANRIHLLLEEVRLQGGSAEDGMSELEPL